MTESDDHRDQVSPAPGEAFLTVDALGNVIEATIVLYGEHRYVTWLDEYRGRWEVPDNDPGPL